MAMKRAVAVGIGSVFVLGALGFGWAQQAPRTGQPEKPAVEKPAAEKGLPAKPAAKLKQLSGSVKAASEESLTLEVVQKDKTTKEYTFSLDPKARDSRPG